jgi:[acyl-carrier-protein] S-malonyltransferase
MWKGGKKSNMKNIAFVFPGQGSQYVGIGKKWYTEYIEVKNIFEQASDLLKFDIAKMCFEGDIAELTKTLNTQLSVFLTSVAAFTVFKKEYAINPVLSAGHSLGEITALTTAGAIKFEDAIKIVKKRGELMQQANIQKNDGAMSAIIGIEADIIREVCNSYNIDENNVVVVANYNSQKQVVISGNRGAVESAGEALKNNGARVVPLQVSNAFHSPIMKAASYEFGKELELYKFNSFNWPVVSNVTGLPYQASWTIRDYLTKQMVMPVLWVDILHYFKNKHVDIIVELGPKKVITKLVNEVLPEVHAYAFDDEEDRKNLDYVINRLKKQYQNATDKKLHLSSVISRCLAVAVATKNENYNDEEYRVGVIEPYQKIKAMYYQIEENGEEPSLEQMRMALDMLKLVFETKRTSYSEQKERFSEILTDTGMGEYFPEYKI